MAFWLLTCNRDALDLDALRRNGLELPSWAITQNRPDLASGDHFVMWVTGAQDGLIGRGRISGAPFFQKSNSNEYRQGEPAPRWYVPLAFDEWLDRAIPRSQFAGVHLFEESTEFAALADGTPYRLDNAQWKALSKPFRNHHTDASDQNPWHLNPGDTIRRVELHDRYGGSRQGGICKSARTDNVLIFTDPDTGQQHGYYDEWAEDGTFHYTGDGQRGDQSFSSLGNKSIRNHIQLGLKLRLFEGSRGVVRYAGEFTIAPDSPYSYARAPETGGGPLRKVIRFHLAPVGPTEQLPSVPIGRAYSPANEWVEPAPAQSSPPNLELTRRNLHAHRSLQNSLATAAAARGLEVLTPRAGDPDFDLAWRDSAGCITVCEVKSLTEANEISQLRTGVGQLLDYHDRLRKRTPGIRAVLWVEWGPSESRWVELCHRVNITLAWPGKEDEVFTTSAADSV